LFSRRHLDVRLHGKRLLRDGWSLFELVHEPGACVEGAVRFTGALAVESFLRRFATDSWSMRTLRVALADTTAGVPDLRDVQVVALLARRIADGWVRVVPVRSPRPDEDDREELFTGAAPRRRDDVRSPWLG
jgi:hypothetical protein